MRIAFFTDVYRPTTNGVVVSIDSFVAELRKQGHTVTIVCPTYPDIDDENDENILRVKAVTFPSYKEYRVASPVSAKLESHMKKHVYDLIHIHSPFAIGLAGIFYAKRYHLPVVYTAHTNYADYLHYIHGASIVPAGAIHKLAARFSNGVDLTLAPSKKISDYLLKHGTTKHVAVLQTGIPPVTLGDRDRFDQRYSTQDSLKFLYVGRVTKEKNLDFLVQAFAQAIPRLSEGAQLVIVGDGPYRDTLTDDIRSLGLEANVTMTGFLLGQDKADAYSAGDVFCYTSYSETQGLALMEAASYGMPLVVSDDSAYADIAVSGVNAVVVANDVSAYAEQLVAMATDGDMRIKLGKGSKDLAQDFTIERQTNVLVELYERTITQKRASIVEGVATR